MSRKLEDIKNKMNSKRNAKGELMGPGEELNSPNVNINDNDNSGLKGIITKEKPRKTAKELVGIYFDKDVKEALDAYQKAEGRGAKSELLNDLARYALEQKGLL